MIALLTVLLQFYLWDPSLGVFRTVWQKTSSLKAIFAVYSKTNKSPFACVINHFTHSPQAKHKTHPVLAVRGHDTDVRGRSVFPAGVTPVRHPDPGAAGKTLRVMFFL